MPYVEKNVRQRTMTRVMDMRLGLIAGRWYDNGLGIAGGTYNHSVTVQPNVLQAVPILLNHDAKLDRIAVHNHQSDATGLIRMGLYTNLRGKPDALLLDAGTVGMSSSAVQEITIDKRYDGGWYWFVFEHSASNPINFHGIDNAEGNGLLGLTNPTDTGRYTHIHGAGGGGLLPQTFPTPSWQAGDVPRVLVRIA